ncbi:MAG TPA: substrate-binding domain-containing protein [Burkholderiaceae bacterium]|jgi:tungstate transport system substrate-binding protein|nr:substrate-binding domain-containing protein [Burkholderiaceae bacterium]
MILPIRRSIAMRALFAAFAGLCCALLCASLPGIARAQPQDRFIVMASTTSTEQSGLFAHLLPIFTRETGIAVRVVAQGTGQALATARRGDADVVLVHDREAEDRFVAEGFGLARRGVMHNDFVLVGPKTDPARVADTRDIAAALRRVAQARQPFVSRGDRSGTHAAELRFWRQAGIDVEAAKRDWYKDSGSGMGPTLNMASAMNGYTLADRGTWLSFRNRGELAIVLQGDPRLFNPYGVIVVNPARHPHVRHELAQRFADWVVSSAGRKAIADYRIGGEQLFFPDDNP